MKSVSPVRDLAARTFAVALVSTVTSLGLGLLVVGGVEDIAPDVTDVASLIAFPFVVTALVLLVHRLTRKRTWWGGPARRWIMGGIVTGSAVMTTALVATTATLFFLATDPPPTGAESHPATEALILVVGIVLLTGLPVWTMLFGVLIGPGDRLGAPLGEKGMSPQTSEDIARRRAQGRVTRDR